MRFLLVVIALFAGLSSGSAALGEKRVALVIGNSAYKNAPKLPNPKNDAKAIGAALARLGFDVTPAYDLGVDGMRAALAKFEDKAAGADWALVYYAGHGMELGGRNWLIPVDAKLARASDMEDEAVALDRVLARVRPARTLRIVLLDACRNNPFLSRVDMGRGGLTRAVDRGFARVEPEHGELVFYAARDGSVAADGEGANSPFATGLLAPTLRSRGWSWAASCAR
ncbi:MAG: caspase family protein [Hyphomicrobiales bacterium]|nr:caspase family protein [Hyphomicrobiales bacterium]